MRCYILVLTAVFGLAASNSARADEKSDLAGQAFQVISTHCLRCHKGPGSEGGTSNFEAMADLMAQSGKKKPLITPGKPDDSRLYQRFAVDEDMPPEAATKALGRAPTKAERDIIQKWIVAGAPAFTATAANRPFISLIEEMTAIRAYLLKVDRNDRAYTRFFTVTHLHNDASIPDEKMKLIRAALSKAMNSLSMKPRIILPYPINKTEKNDATVYAVDIRLLDWDTRRLWEKVLEAYPYGVLYTHHPDLQLKKVAQDIEDYSKTPIPSIRADWFVATAMRPPLYHTMLGIPKHAGTLEKALGVDVRYNFETDKLARAGFAKSGVSAQNRLVERHDARTGSYWKSYDFKPETGRGRLIRFPLGPLNLFPEGKHPYFNQAFTHDGGEAIFSLPNHLSGYMLMDGKDNRIDEGPISVVGDSKKTAGTAAIVNGISCMACHTRGMIELKDFVRDGAAVFGKADEKVRMLYPDNKRMEEIIRHDQDLYLDALTKATGPFLQVGPDKNKSIADFPEPCGYVSITYRSSYLNVAQVAADLYYKDPKEMMGRIGAKRIKELGLAALLTPDGLITRLEWEAVDGYSLMQEVAKELGGTPVGK